MLKKTFEGFVEYIQVLDEFGTVDKSLLPEDVTDSMILEMYKSMSKARALDAKALSLQRQGRIFTYPPLLGEEASQVGSAMAFRRGDIIVPNYRQHAVFMLRGLPLDRWFVSLRGFEDGAAINGAKDTPVSVPIGTHLPHAVGLAYAEKYKKSGNVVVSYIGDGGTSEGDFYEALNFAGVFKVPLVIIIVNNQWAISVPRRRQSAAQTLAQKAFAAGLKGVQVDGNDVVGMYKVVKDALSAAANNEPTVIECITYRLSMHTTADDPTKYRTDGEVKEWEAKEPLIRVRRYLTSRNLWDDSKEKDMQEEFKKEIDEALAKAEAFKPDPKSIFEHIYSFMPEVLKEEQDAAIAAGFWLDTSSHE
ncbi:MAG: pyruvate dehydrogenase (acetyl-transferring) E1 component subunit alpha [Candidatus Marsarchaeota archaeon]|nr:pyruvate dehydrogenase (acetyl-transferring) E1 component subunit alpha [Candidatus Marsarchaeota archaeon]